MFIYFVQVYEMPKANMTSRNQEYDNRLHTWSLGSLWAILAEGLFSSNKKVVIRVLRHE